MKLWKCHSHLITACLSREVATKFPWVNVIRCEARHTLALGMRGVGVEIGLGDPKEPWDRTCPTLCPRWLRHQCLDLILRWQWRSCDEVQPQSVGQADHEGPVSGEKRPCSCQMWPWHERLRGDEPVLCIMVVGVDAADSCEPNC